MSEATTKISPPWLASPPLRRVFAALSAEGSEARVVGGAVRNALLDRPAADIDLATPVLPDDVMRLARAAGLGVHPTGIGHGTVTVVANGQPFEVTTLRRDVATDGRHATVAFTQDWAEDAHRRDFTINALYATADGRVIDLTGGVADLAARRVRFIGSADDRIREDYLRILRFYRFSAEYAEGPLDAIGVAATERLKDGLGRLSSERIWSELRKLLRAPRAGEVAAIMEQHGILAAVLGGETDARTLARLIEIESATGSDPDVMARLAALIPQHRTPSELITRLRLSNTEAEELEVAMAAAAAAGGIAPDAPETAAKAAIYALGQESFLRAQHVAWARSNASVTDPAWRARTALAASWTPPRMPFTGVDVLALGIAPGPRVGAILSGFEDWWIAADFPSDPALLQRTLIEHAKRG